MAKKTQKTKQGAAIPVPTRGDLFADLKKAAATPEKLDNRLAPRA